MKRSFGRAGFTLVEFMVGLCVAGLIMAGAVAMVGESVPNWRLHQAAGDVAATLRAARAKAVQDGDNVTVPFDIDGQRYVVVTRGAGFGVEVQTTTYFDAAKAAPCYSTQRTSRLPGQVRFARPDGQELITLSPPGTSDKAVQFNAKGLLLSRTSSGFVYIGIPDKKLYRRVKVNVVGAVTVETWNGSKWV